MDLKQGLPDGLRRDLTLDVVMLRILGVDIDPGLWVSVIEFPVSIVDRPGAWVRTTFDSVYDWPKLFCGQKRLHVVGPTLVVI